MNSVPIGRYPGARPFADDPTDSALFFGRDQEIDTLFHRLCATRLLVLFGKSGLGKTSLLQAGVFPKLRQRQMLPLAIRLNIEQTPLDIIKEAAKLTSQKKNIDYTPGEGETLWAFFKTAMFWQGDEFLTPVLVFDQFEEIFTLKSTAERAALASELGDLFRGTLPQNIRQQRRSALSKPDEDIVSLSEQAPNVRVVLSVREDYLGALQELACDIPGIFEDRVRLSPLSKEEATLAIRQPAILGQAAFDDREFLTAPFRYAGDALEEILDFLRGKSDVIEPFQLQLLCRSIEEQVAQQAKRSIPLRLITIKELGGRKRLQTVVQDFYRQTLSQLSRRERCRAQRLCEEGLLNKEGFRLPLQENEILKGYKLSKRALAMLVNARLLRKEPRLESYFYELSHDSLAQPILEMRPLRLSHKQRSAVAATLSLVIMLAIFGFMQFQAKQEADAARNRAERARTVAEEVLSFMVFDLRDKLEPIGRLDIVKEVQQRVNRYYEQMGIEGLPATILNTRASAFSNEGDRFFAQGDLEQAQWAYQKFLSLTQQVVNLEPDKLLWQRNTSVAINKLGDVLSAQGKKSEAQQAYEVSLEIARKLSFLEPSNIQWQRGLLVSLNRLGDMLSAQGKLSEAQQAYQNGLEIAQKLRVFAPNITGWQRDLFVSLEKVGDALSAQGKLSEAQKNYQEGLEIARKLITHNPNNAQWQRDLSVSLVKIGDVLSAQSKLLEAQKAYQEGLEIARKLIIHDPSNTQWQRDLSVSLKKIGDVLSAQGKFPEAQQAYQNALKIARNLSIHNPKNTKWKRDLSVLLEKFGDALRAQDKLPEAQQAYQDSLSILKKLSTSDNNSK